MDNLPEPILCHILSFLPTKTATACSLLSQRWKYLWSLVPVLDFDLYRDAPDEELRFVQSVEKALLLPRGIPIKTFRLAFTLEEEYCGDLNHCISSARGLEELHLHSIDITFPTGVDFTNMLVLKLTRTYLGPVESGFFPKLKVLHLSDVYFEGGGSLENLLSACPVLEELRKHGGQYCSHLRICVPTLISLVIEPEIDRKWRVVANCPELLLETPLLEYLRYSHYGSRESLISANLRNLRRASVSSFVGKRDTLSYVSGALELLSMLSSVEFLRLSYDPIWVIEGASVRFHGFVHGLDYSRVDELPVFHNLVRLELCIPSCDCALLPHLLRKFHSLEYVSIDKKLDPEVDEASWKEPLQVPICFSSTLLTFQFQGFEGYEAEVELVNYVMKHAIVLKNLTINASLKFEASMKRVDAVRKLPMVQRGSEAYQLDFN